MIENNTVLKLNSTILGSIGLVYLPKWQVNIVYMIIIIRLSQGMGLYMHPALFRQILAVMFFESICATLSSPKHTKGWALGEPSRLNTKDLSVQRTGQTSGIYPLRWLYITLGVFSPPFCSTHAAYASWLFEFTYGRWWTKKRPQTPTTYPRHGPKSVDG